MKYYQALLVFKFSLLVLPTWNHFVTNGPYSCLQWSWSLICLTTDSNGLNLFQGSSDISSTSLNCDNSRISLESLFTLVNVPDFSQGQVVDHLCGITCLLDACWSGASPWTNRSWRPLCQRAPPADCMEGTFISPQFCVSSSYSTGKNRTQCHPLCLLELQLCKPSLFKEAQIWAVKLKLVPTVAHSWAIHLHVLMKRRWNKRTTLFLSILIMKQTLLLCEKMSTWRMTIDSSSQTCTLGRWLLNKIRDLFV